MPSTIHGEEMLGQRCSVTFQISPKVQQACQGSVTKCEASLGKNNTAAPGGAAGRNILYRQWVALDNGGELWLDLVREEAEGRLQWLLPDLAAAEDGAPETGEEPPNKKQKEDEEDTVAGNAFMESLCINSDTLRDVLPTIVSFLDPGERNEMALANSNLRDAVEIHSSRMLAKIVKEHAVDDTFEARIRDQTRISTTRSKPVQLPDRYLLDVAKKTRLYTLVPPTPRAGSGIALTLNSSKTRLAFAQAYLHPENRAYVQIYDLATKRLVRHFTFPLYPGESRKLRAIDYFENLVVVCTSDVVRVFTEAGQLLRQCENIGRIFCSTRHEQIVFLDLMDGIYSFDIRSGSTKRVLTFEIDRTTMILGGVCGGRWLVVQNRWKGIHVYDLTNECSMNHFWEGSYDSMIQCSENPSIFCAHKDSPHETHHVLELSCEGKLTCLSCFSSDDYKALVTNIQGRYLFLRNCSDMLVVKSMDGKIERNFRFLGHDIKSIVPNGAEVFVGLSTLNGSPPGGNQMITVDAFYQIISCKIRCVSSVPFSWFKSYQQV